MVFEALGVLMAATVQGVFVNSTRVAGDCAKNGKESSTVAPEQLDDEVFFFPLINNENLRLSHYYSCRVIFGYEFQKVVFIFPLFSKNT